MNYFALTRVVAPAPVVTLQEAREQLRVDTYGSPPSNPEDELIARLVQSATEELDAGTGWLGRALGAQTWRLSLNEFPAATCGIRLPYPPFIELVSFTYTDTDGNTQPLTVDTDFRLFNYDGFSVLRPTYQGAWPNARQDFDSVQITFRAGYVTGSPEASAVPEMVKNWILSRVEQLFTTRGVDNNMAGGAMSDSIMQSLNSLRVYGNEP